jgi:hypothetical protein
MTYVWRKIDWGRGQVQFRGVERLIQKIGWVELVQHCARQLRCRHGLLLLRLTSQSHAAHALGDASNATGSRARSRAGSRIALVGSLVATICGLRRRLLLLLLSWVAPLLRVLVALGGLLLLLLLLRLRLAILSTI